MATRPAPIILVPGFWLGAWAWDEVATALRDDGHEVTAITLPGLESLQAEVVWWENNMCGCAFTSLLSPIVHDNILARYRGDGVYRG